MSEDILFTRRSIRKYIKGKQVEDEKIEYMLRAAMYAPSANNRRNWEFHSGKNRDTLDKIMNAHPYAKILDTATLAIVVCGDLSDESGRLYGSKTVLLLYRNLMLAAKAKDLGSVWIGLAPREERMNEIIELLSIPENIKPLGLVVIGYPDGEPEMPDTFDLMKIHYEKY